MGMFAGCSAPITQPGSTLAFLFYTQGSRGLLGLGARSLLGDKEGDGRRPVQTPLVSPHMESAHSKDLRATLKWDFWTSHQDTGVYDRGGCMNWPQNQKISVSGNAPNLGRKLVDAEMAWTYLEKKLAAAHDVERACGWELGRFPVLAQPLTC